jgi:hypothetical protein
MGALDECADLGAYLERLAEIEAHDERLAAADEATAGWLAALGVIGNAEAQLGALCAACGQTGRDCGSRAYRGLYPMDSTARDPLHPELRQLLDRAGLDLTRCCVACSHDQFGHRAHDRAVAKVRAEHRTSPAAALAALEGRRFDPSLAPVSTATREEEN